MSINTEIEWRPEFSTGNQSVDHEHQELIHLINRIFQMISEEGSKNLVLDALGDVYAKIAAHFALEELIMRRSSYEDYQPHKDDHEDLLDEIRNIMDAYETGGYNEERDNFTAHLTTWFVTHFSTMDSKLHSATLI